MAPISPSLERIDGNISVILSIFTPTTFPLGKIFAFMRENIHTYNVFLSLFPLVFGKLPSRLLMFLTNSHVNLLLLSRMSQTSLCKDLLSPAHEIFLSKYPFKTKADVTFLFPLPELSVQRFSKSYPFGTKHSSEYIPAYTVLLSIPL